MEPPTGKTGYAGRNPVEGVNGMIKDDGSFNPESSRVFGLAAHTLAALMAAVIHNLEQTRRTRNRKKHNNVTPTCADQTHPDTAPPDTAATRPTSPTPTRAPP